MTQAALASALGMSEPAVSKFKGRGMPVDSVAAAQAWRATHVRLRISANPVRRFADEIADVHALWPVARSALQAGRLEAALPALRAAMRAVPEEARHLVELDDDVMGALCAPFAELLRSHMTPEERAAPMPDADIEAMGRVWYCLAAGERFPAAWLEESCAGDARTGG